MYFIGLLKHGKGTGVEKNLILSKPDKTALALAHQIAIPKVQDLMTTSRNIFLMFNIHNVYPLVFIHNNMIHAQNEVFRLYTLRNNYIAILSAFVSSLN